MKSRSISAAPAPVWNQGTPTSTTFFPMTAPISTDGIATIRSSIFVHAMRSPTDELELWVAYQTSNDGVTWEAAVKVKASQKATANSELYGSTFEDHASNMAARQLVRFGILSDNATSSSSEGLAYAGLQVDLQGC